MRLERDPATGPVWLVGSLPGGSVLAPRAYLVRV